MVSTIVKPRVTAGYNNSNVNTKNTNKKTKKKTKNAKTAIPFKNLKGSPNMVKKQSLQNANYNVNTKSKSKSKTISGGFDLSPLISAILLAGIKLSLNQNKKLVDKSKSTKSPKSPKSPKSTKSAKSK
jgi:hypothetical protein